MHGPLSKREGFRQKLDDSNKYLKELDKQGIEYVEIYLRNYPQGERKGCSVCKANNKKKFKVKELLRIPEPRFWINHINCQCGLRPVGKPKQKDPSEKKSTEISSNKPSFQNSYQEKQNQLKQEKEEKEKLEKELVKQQLISKVPPKNRLN